MTAESTPTTANSSNISPPIASWQQRSPTSAYIVGGNCYCSRDSSKRHLRLCFLSLIVATVVMLGHNTMLVVAHERLYEKSDYPILPDIFFDLFPHIPEAFQVTEVIILLDLLALICLAIFHVKRLVLIRRFLLIMSFVYLLRATTVASTTLTYATESARKLCSSVVYHNNYERFLRVLELSTGLGLSVRGITTCADYVFSGHTILLTLCNLFLQRYTRQPVLLLHTSPPLPFRNDRSSLSFGECLRRPFVYLRMVSWVANLLGMFLIMLSRNHYLIDVLLAFYITTGSFLLYHLFVQHIGSRPTCCQPNNSPSHDVSWRYACNDDVATADSMEEMVSLNTVVPITLTMHHQSYPFESDYNSRAEASKLLSFCLALWCYVEPYCSQEATNIFMNPFKSTVARIFRRNAKL